MSLLQAFWDDYQYKVRERMEQIEPEYKGDFSNFTVVDGEEGDFGTIQYSLHGVLLATKIVHGGDSEEYKWTYEGRSIMKEMLMSCIKGL